MTASLAHTRAHICPASDLQAEDHTTVVIVGGGACGLTAALALHRLGVECVVLERDAFAAGSTALSSGFIPAPCTQAQQAQGITDSVEAFAADIQAKAHGLAAPHLVQAYAQNIGPAMDALAQHHGLPWQVLDNFLYPGHSAHRMHAVPEKTGAGLMSRLQAAADAVGVVVLTQAQVTELWADEAQRFMTASEDGTSDYNCVDVIREAGATVVAATVTAVGIVSAIVKFA